MCAGGCDDDTTADESHQPWNLISLVVLSLSLSFSFVHDYLLLPTPFILFLSSSRVHFFFLIFFILFSFFSCRLSTNSRRFFIQSSARHPTVSLLPLMHIIFLKIYSQFSISYDHFVCFFPSSNSCFLLAFLLWQNHTHVLSCWKPFRLFFFVCVYFSLISGLTKWVSELVPDSFLPPHYLWFFFFSRVCFC